MPDILDPRQMQFWTAEERRLWERLSLLVLRIFTAGGVAGEKLLPERLRILVNWDRVNEQALRYLDDYRLRMVGAISNTTREKTIKAIEDWVRSGEPLPNLEARLERWFAGDRAHRVAVTEVTRIYAEGNQKSWESTGFVGANKWQTAVDERVCPVCGPLHNVIVPLGEGFTPDGPGEGPTAPPLHPLCRCWLLPVVDPKLLGNELDRIIEEA